MKHKKLLLLPAVAFSSSILSGCALIPTVTWTNWDGTILEVDKDVFFGSVPTYDGNKPTKPSTPEFDYEFEGWDREVSKAWLLHIGYTAQFKEIKRSYSVTYKETKFGTIKTESILYGETPSWTPNTSDYATAQYSYKFTGWNEQLEPVTCEATYTTTFVEQTRSYLIKFVDYNGTVLKSEQLEYGQTPVAPDDPTRKPDNNYVYTFSGWDKTIDKVKGATTYTAKYSSRDRVKVNISYFIDEVEQSSGIYQDSILEYSTLTLPSYSATDYYDLEWYLSPDMKPEEIVQNNEVFIGETDATLYGKRVAEHQFKITYNLGTGAFLPSGHKYPETVTNSQIIDLDSCCEDIFYAPRLANHMFEKWLDKDNHDITTISNTTSDIVLKAVYKVVKFNIYFDWPSLSHDSIEVTYNGEDYLEKLKDNKYILSEDGFNFLGWSFSYDDRTIVNGPYLFDHDVTLVPIFEFASNA